MERVHSGNFLLKGSLRGRGRNNGGGLILLISCEDVSERSPPGKPTKRAKGPLVNQTDAKGIAKGVSCLPIKTSTTCRASHRAPQLALIIIPPSSLSNYRLRHPAATALPDTPRHPKHSLLAPKTAPGLSSLRSSVKYFPISISISIIFPIVIT